MATAPVEVPSSPAVEAISGTKETVCVGGSSPPALNIVEILKRLEGRLKSVDYLDSLQLQSIGIGVAPTTDSLKITPGGTTRRAVLIKGVQFQSANLFEVQDSDGNTLYELAPDGDVEHNVSGTVDAWAVKHNDRVFLGVTTQKDKEYLELGNLTDQPALRIYGPARGGETTGTNATGSDLIVAGGRGRGSGAGGHLLFKTAPAGATGTDYNTESTHLEVSDDATEGVRVHTLVRGNEPTAADTAGSDLIVAGGRGRGTGAGGHLLFKTTAAGGAGSDYNTEATLLEITDDSKIGLFGATPVVQQSDIGALVDNIGGAVSTTLAAITDPADTPATADALRDDLVANAIPEIRDALSSLADQINDIRTVLQNLGAMA
jgi:hypothetical protein